MDRWTATATVTTVQVRVIRWRCPDCDTYNKTVLWPNRPRRSYSDVEARCGKCHGTSRKLLTRGYTIDQ